MRRTNDSRQCCCCQRHKPEAGEASHSWVLYSCQDNTAATNLQDRLASIQCCTHAHSLVALSTGDADIIKDYLCIRVVSFAGGCFKRGAASTRGCAF